VACVTDILEDMLPPTLVFKYLNPEAGGRQLIQREGKRVHFHTTSAFALKISAE
jgi:hypothetical protein